MSKRLRSRQGLSGHASIYTHELRLEGMWGSLNEFACSLQLKGVGGAQDRRIHLETLKLKCSLALVASYRGMEVIFQLSLLPRSPWSNKYLSP